MAEPPFSRAMAQRGNIMFRVPQTTMLVFVLLGLSAAQTGSSNAPQGSASPWMNTQLTPEERADLLIGQMTLEQKVEQISNDTRPAENPANRPPGCEFTQVGRHI